MQRGATTFVNFRDHEFLKWQKAVIKMRTRSRISIIVDPSNPAPILSTCLASELREICQLFVTGMTSSTMFILALPR